MYYILIVTSTKLLITYHEILMNGRVKKAKKILKECSVVLFFFLSSLLLVTVHLSTDSRGGEGYCFPVLPHKRGLELTTCPPK